MNNYSNSFQKTIDKAFFQLDPISYGKNRNYMDGSVSRLGAYISRGFLTTRSVYNYVSRMSIDWKAAERFIQELAWRDYWQQIWISRGNEIFQDLKSKQMPVVGGGIPLAIKNAKTGIHSVDLAINELYETGYMHNHMRMYVASICCNIAQCHWSVPAKWMYAHLKDGDLASNHLSWQWVAGTKSKKKYYANQENINKFFYSNQKNTFLDVEYDVFSNMSIPNELLECCDFEMDQFYPLSNEIENLESKEDVLVYNYYNIDPHWREGENVIRIFLIEPSIFELYPVSKASMNFALDLAKSIEGMKVFVGEFEELKSIFKSQKIFFKEHPLNNAYKGSEISRDWMTSVVGEYDSFFKFWKKAKKQLRW